MSDRKDAYSNNNESFEAPPHIKKKRSDCLQRKAKSVAIKVMNAAKKNKETKKVIKENSDKNP
jgi:hypothetical protein